MPLTSCTTKIWRRCSGAFQRALEIQAQVITTEFRCRQQDGSYRYLEVVGQNRLSDPDIAGVVLNSRDISDRKRAEERWREGEKQYRLIFEGSPTPIWIADLETYKFLEVNEAAIQHYGYSREEFMARSTRDIRSGGETERYNKYFENVVKNGRETSWLRGLRPDQKNG